ncbi:MAG: YifB family Mg chelatase-like AAA ATPase, partial [Marmoricola sp.]
RRRPAVGSGTGPLRAPPGRRLMYATARTVSLAGSVGHVVDVQVDVSAGLIAAVMVGRPDVAITESRDRCRAAVQNSGFEWPVTRRITILLSPADLPKRGSHFDLAIAVGVLVASDSKMPRHGLESAVFIGELSLDGRVRSVPGVLPMVMAARTRGCTTVYVPEPQAAEAAMVDGVAVWGVRSLAQVMALLTGAEVPDAPPVEPLTAAPLLAWVEGSNGDQVDYADVFGMSDARFGLEVAASGGHHLLLSGPKGAGKTTLAERLPTILPDLHRDEALELTAVHSLAGALTPGAELIRRPPFRAPHHSASRTAVLGGGSGRVRPGEISKAHLGVLFLDEFPLFPADVIDALREPLESGLIRLSRGEEDAVFPAKGIVVLGCNPCPCGEFSATRADHRCECSEVRRREYRRKLRGPVLDRVDITRHVEPLRPHEYSPTFGVPESSAAMAARVAEARHRQHHRYRADPWRLNGHVPGPVLKARWPLEEEAAASLHGEVLSGALTQRGGVRVHRLAWTVADLAGRSRPTLSDLQTALRLRTGEPLDLRALDQRGIA